MRLLIATTNQGKLREIRDLLADAPVELVSLAGVEPVDEPEETGLTFAANARLKARYYAAHADLPTVAEDSGLVIDALDGEPGVWSARWLGANATYPERFAEISHRLAARPDRPRTARFVCALTLVAHDEILFEANGTVEGGIIDAPRGDGGFGYDPIFYYPPYRATLAEVSQADKLRIAHRGQAFRQLAEWFGSDDGRAALSRI
jgi:XTP/dITP diphosphohydrolase